MPVSSISVLKRQLREVAATTIARWWRAIAARIARGKEIQGVATALRAAAGWRPRGGEKANAIIVLNLLCDQDPKRAKSGIDEVAQLNASARELEAETGAPVLLQTFKRGPVLKVSANVRTFIASCAGGAIHVVVTAHGGVTWGHYLGKTLVPHASFLAPNVPNVQRGAVWSLPRNAILAWSVEYLTRHGYAWPRNAVTVSLDICQICADLADSADTTGYVAAETLIAGKCVRYRGPVHAAFAHEMRHVVPAHMLETGPFNQLVDVVRENARLKERVAELEANDLDLSITSLMNMLDVQGFE